MLSPDALPDCDSCEKPELTPENQEVAMVFRYVQDQQMWEQGMSYGLRLEAVREAIDMLEDRGMITDPDMIMDRIWILSDVYRNYHNRRVAADRERRRKEAEAQAKGR